MIIPSNEFHVVRDKSDTFLVQGMEKVQLEGLRFHETKVGRHVFRFGDMVPLQIDGKKFDTQKLLETWLENDSIWGGHKVANELRYHEQRQHSLGAFLTQVAPQSNGTALGIVTLRNVSSSYGDIRGQVLVRIEGSTFKFLRLLSTLDGGAFSPPCALRIFQGSSGQMLWANDKLFYLAKSGKLGHFISLVPSGAPISFAQGRYVVVLRSGEEQRDYYCFDLQKSKVARLFHETSSQNGEPHPSIKYWPEAGSYLIAQSRIGHSQNYTVNTLHVPDGHQVRMQGEPWLTWKGYAISIQSNQVTVFDARTGKRLANLLCPPLPATPKPVR